eukprot:SAG25_NODE_4965_length_722_cov_153.078652_1_plen_73_part_10
MALKAHGLEYLANGSAAAAAASSVIVASAPAATATVAAAPVAIETGGQMIGLIPPVAEMIGHDLCKYLLQNSQ